MSNFPVGVVGKRLERRRQSASCGMVGKKLQIPMIKRAKHAARHWISDRGMNDLERVALGHRCPPQVSNDNHNRAVSATVIAAAVALLIWNPAGTGARMKCHSSFLVAALLLASLSGCSAVDSHLETRILAANTGNNSARNASILLNILRASDSQPLGFMVLSKASGTQTTDLKLGLPTISIGKGLTTAQKQVVFGNNIWENSAQSSFDSAPLESGDFYKAMSSSIDLGTMQALIRQGFSRELVFSSLFGSIVAQAHDRPVAFEYHNDPLLHDPGCNAVAGAYGDRGNIQAAIDLYAPGKDKTGCEQRHFEFLLEAALKWGLNIESYSPAKDSVAKSGPTARASTGQASAQASVPAADDGKAPGKAFRFCFDLAYATGLPVDDPDIAPFICGAKRSPNADSDQLRVKFGGAEQDYVFTVRPRSGLGLFRYLGHVYRAEQAFPGGEAGPTLYWAESLLELAPAERAPGMKFVNIEVRPSPNAGSCFARVAYSSKSYCVPLANSTTTKQLFSMTAQLIALSTTASALPTTLDVRVQ